MTPQQVRVSVTLLENLEELERCKQEVTFTGRVAKVLVGSYQAAIPNPVMDYFLEQRIEAVKAALRTLGVEPDEVEGTS